MKHYPKLRKTEAIKAIKSGIKLHWYGNPELKKYYDDKDFLLNHIRYSYISISDVSARLQNDKEIIIAWLKKRDFYINRHLPKICFENEDIIEWILDNKKEESLNFLMSLKGPLQTKERIIQTLGQTIEPLRAKKIKYFEPSKISLKKILGKTSLFEKFHIATWDPASPIWMIIKKANIYENIELKQEALKFSPGAAFIFMINNEISIEKYANIFVESIFKNRYSMGPCSTYPYYDHGKWEYITTDGFLAISSFSQKEFNSLQDSIFNLIFKKTKDINKIETFLEAFPCFSTTFSQKKIIESIDLNKTSNHYFIQRYYYKSFLKFPRWRREKTEAFLVNNINFAKILHTIKNNPKLAASHIFEIFYNEIDDFCWYNNYNKDIANSEQALSFYKTLSKKVYSSKIFLIEFIGVIGFGATSENNPVGTNEFAKELFKGMIKYLESTRDFEMLKKVMKVQAVDSNDFTNKASLIYFHISDRLKTPEIIEYFLFIHLDSLDSHSLPTKFDHFDLCLKDQKYFSKALNDEFYFKLVSKSGMSCFEIPRMAEKIKHLFDNKEFMINAILKSYKALKFASDRIKSDPDVVKIAWLKNSKSFTSASATLKKNKVFLNDIFYNEPINIFLNAHHSIRLDVDIYLPALKTDISYVSHLTANQILKINTSLFNKSERLSISDEFFKKMNLGDDVLLIAKYKNDFL